VILIDRGGRKYGNEESVRRENKAFFGLL